jgi:hypothetical protein
VLSLFLTDFAPFSERLDSAVARLEAMPAFFEQARRNLHQAPQAWTQRAIRECQGGLIFLKDGVDILIQEERTSAPDLRRAADRAALALAEFKHFLETDLIQRGAQSIACGEQALDLLLRKGHFLEMNAEAVAAFAQEHLQQARLDLESLAAELGANSWAEALEGLAELHPSQADYLDRYTQFWNACRAVTIEHDLLTWPDFPIRYIPQPRWARKAAPFLYFLFYRAPAAFNRPPVHNYLVTPIEPDLPPQEIERLLRSNNDSVIKLNHVVHHGGLGHHVQNWHAYRSSSRLGQVAAVDCASRVAMFCGLTMAEGWACYATDLMGEAGFLTPLEKLAELQTNLRMCSRSIVDIRLHQGRMSLEDAVQFYTENAGMSREFAESEAVKNSMNPGAAVIYLLGREEIKQLRNQMETRLGKRFSLKQFHDEFLAYGSIPVTLISKEMMRKLDHAQ